MGVVIGFLYANVVCQ